MKPAIPSSARRIAPWYTRLVVWLWIHLALIGLVLAGFALREYSIARSIRSESASNHRAEQVTLSVSGFHNRALSESVERCTSKQATAEWLEILEVVHNRFVIDRVRALEASGTNDDKIELRHELLSDLRWLIERTKVIGKLEKPVWVPIAFDGFHTLLPQYNGLQCIQQLMVWDFQDAIWGRDYQRADEALEGMWNNVAAFDWSISSVDESAGFYRREDIYRCIRSTLESSYWDVGRLDRQLERLAPIDNMEQRWNQLMEGGYHAMLGTREIGNPDQRAARQILNLPSMQIAIRDDLERSKRIGQVPIEGMRASEREIRKQCSTLASLESQGFGVVSGLVQEYERNEIRRRFTRTALGIARFHRVNQRFPKTLKELESIGFAEPDWAALSVGPFGYMLENNDSTARLWCNGCSSERRIHSQKEMHARGWEQSTLESQHFEPKMLMFTQPDRD